MILFNPKLNNWLKNLVYVNFLAHFLINISQYPIKIYIQFKIVAHYNLKVIVFFVFFIEFLIFLNTLRTVSFTQLVNNTQFALQIIFKGNLITNPHIISVFQFWIFLVYQLHLYFPIVYCFFIYPYFYTCYILTVLYRTHGIFYRFFFAF